MQKIVEVKTQVEDTDWVTDYEAHINSHQVCSKYQKYQNI